MAEPARPLRVLVMGHLGGRNLGDEAMFDALRGLTPKGRAVQWLVPVPDPAAAPDYGPGVTLVPYSGRRLLAALKRCDAYLVCGGTSFHDQYEGPAHSRHRRTMAKFVGLSALARVMGKPALLLGIGVGPIRRPATRRLTRLWLRLANRVIVRDRASLALCREAGLAPPRLALAADLAHLLAPVLASPPPEAKPTGRVLVNVMDPVAFRGSDPAAVAGLYADLAAALAAAHPAARIDVAAIGVGAVDNDSAACAAFADSLRRKAPEAAVETVTLTGLGDFATRAKAAEVVVTTRLHAAVLAYLSGARVLSLVYHPKIPAVFEGLTPQGDPRLVLLSPGEGDPAAALARLAGAEPRIPAIPESLKEDRQTYARALFGPEGAP